MRKNSIARFTAAALIVAAVLLFIVGIIPVIAVALGGLGAGWGTGSRLWLVGPLATCVCGSSLFLLACGAMLLVLTRIQGNLAGWRDRQAEVAASRAAAVPVREIAPAALAAGVVTADAAVAPALVGAGGEAVALEAESGVATGPAVEEAALGIAPLAAGETAVEAEHVGPGAPLAVAGIAAAAVAVAHEERAEATPEEVAAAAAAAEIAMPEVEIVAPAISEAEAALPEAEIAAPEAEVRGPGLGAVIAGAGIAAAAVAVAHEEKAESAPEEVAVSGAEAALPEPEVTAPGAEIRGPGLGAVVAGAGIAAAAVAVAHEEKAEAAPEEVAVAAEAALPEVEVTEPAVFEAEAALPEVSAPEAEGGGVGLGAVVAGAGLAAAAAVAHEEPEPMPIPESAPLPEPGAPSVEILDSEVVLTVPDETRGGAIGDAAVAAGLAAVATQESEAEPEQEAVTLETVVQEPDSPEPPAEAQVGAEAAAPAVGVPAAPAPSRAWTYDQGTSKVAQAVGIQNTQGIGQVYAGKLREAGITTTAALLRAGSTPKGRKELADKTGISPKQILKWINHVDLARIKGISEQYADLLEWAGVDTVPALAQRNADNLLQKLTEVNEARRLVRRLPTLGMVASWIAQAKELPRVVVYK